MKILKSKHSAYRILIGLIFFAHQMAEAQTLYQVELVVFERKGLARTLGSRTVAPDLALSYPTNAVALADIESGATNNSYPVLPVNVLPASSDHLASQAAVINSNKQMRVLFHKSWLQPIGETAPAIAISGGNQFGEHWELEGYLVFSNNKTLEVDAQLWLSQFMPDNGQPMVGIPALPILPSVKAPSLATNSLGFITTLVVPLQQRQKLKLGEIYYLDHPVLGGLVSVQATE